MEDEGKKTIGRIRLWWFDNASGDDLMQFFQEMAKPGSTIKADDWSDYKKRADKDFQHVGFPAQDLRIVHLAISLLNRWSVRIKER